MKTLVLLLLTLLLVGAGVWFSQRLRRIRQQAMARAAAALEALLAASHTRTPPTTGEVVDTAELESARAVVASAPAPTPLVRVVPTPPEEDEISQILTDELVLPPLRPSARAQPAGSVAGDAPLRSLVLAWFEARGYHLLAVAPTAWPIEGRLVHHESLARSYAFVVQSERVSHDRITALLEQAAELDLRRVALVAESGVDPGARESARRRHVRLIDRAVMQAELAELPREAAARIVAAARCRPA